MRPGLRTEGSNPGGRVFADDEMRWVGTGELGPAERLWPPAVAPVLLVSPLPSHGNLILFARDDR